jgi:hypothetical protein
MEEACSYIGCGLLSHNRSFIINHELPSTVSFLAAMSLYFKGSR